MGVLLELYSRAITYSHFKDTSFSNFKSCQCSSDHSRILNSTQNASEILFASLVWYLYYQEACYLRLTALRYLLVTLAQYLVFTGTVRPMTCRYKPWSDRKDLMTFCPGQSIIVHTCTFDETLKIGILHCIVTKKDK